MIDETAFKEELAKELSSLLMKSYQNLLCSRIKIVSPGSPEIVRDVKAMSDIALCMRKSISDIDNIISEIS